MLLIYFYLFIFSAVHAYYGFRPPEKKTWYGLLLILFLFILIIMDDIYTFQGYYSFFLLYCLFSPFILLPIPIYFPVIVSSFTIFSDWRDCLKMAGWDGWAGGPVCWL